MIVKVHSVSAMIQAMLESLTHGDDTKTASQW